jgi:hypothetical protein
VKRFCTCHSGKFVRVREVPVCGTCGEEVSRGVDATARRLKRIVREGVASGVTLTSASVEQVAQRVVEVSRETTAPTPKRSKGKTLGTSSKGGRRAPVASPSDTTQDEEAA